MQTSGTNDVATWRSGDAVELERPANRMAQPLRPGSRVRIARFDARQWRALPNVGNARPNLADSASMGSKITLRVRGRRVIVVDESAIEWVDGAGNYVRIHVSGTKHQVRGTLNEVEEVLAGAAEHFVRVHRSTIINMRSVREFGRTQYGDLIAVLHCGQRLMVGRVYRRKVEELLGTRL